MYLEQKKKKKKERGWSVGRKPDKIKEANERTNERTNDRKRGDRRGTAPERFETAGTNQTI